MNGRCWSQYPSIPAVSPADTAWDIDGSTTTYHPKKEDEPSVSTESRLTPRGK